MLQDVALAFFNASLVRAVSFDPFLHDRLCLNVHLVERPSFSRIHPVEDQRAGGEEHGEPNNREGVQEEFLHF